MANYRPKAVTVAASLADSGTSYTKDISTSTWGMFLLRGTALSPTGAAMQSGAVQVWESTAPTTEEAQHTTFTDAVGRYGVTCKANVALVIKFFGV
ncbi:hypothetical protein [Clostridium kluyveri]|uniref:Uncharacterized protein n=3 Tax=Clostridium kluyveri TaxID=1534 RepID=A5N046_CLOK5|nr:hypothetical protein [Clostridium kluyveri]APM39747.1 hypothetical protein BS101_13895 [Clostridium kluyveri]EDK34492.1 Hypothetical protein CKL_2480 [Clostridium kluyveri DSM 555]UZQ50091.1 hypothetical protein OP486_19430 [Clostridium kluyveri]BAH07243.1 hypothetical protein CKR_2192 [Clostridium kluyveri NBRC 12016]